jgi:hypothetical protein
MERIMELGIEAVFLDARRRVAMVFRMNIVLSLTAAVTLIGATVAAIVFGFLGQDMWATALGGVALLDLVGAAVYRPLDQMNRALREIQRIDMTMLCTRERLRAVEDVADIDDRAAAMRLAWTEIIADLKELQKD